MIKTIIAAKAKNNVIGKNGKMPWYLPEDLNFFQNITMGHTLVMGRRTHESLELDLEGRKVIVLSHHNTYSPEHCIVKNDLESAYNFARKENEDKLFIAGGGTVYRETISSVDNMYITQIHRKFEGDVYFPKIDQHRWNKKALATFWRKKEDIDSFTIFEYTRK